MLRATPHYFWQSFLDERGSWDSYQLSTRRKDQLYSSPFFTKPVGALSTLSMDPLVFYGRDNGICVNQRWKVFLEEELLRVALR